MTATIKRPAFRYHGSKWRLAPWIISHFPEHRLYVEPFGGAAGVLLRKVKSRGEVYNDLDGDVVNFFRVLRDPDQRARLIDLVRFTPYARAEFKSAYQPCEDPVERARRLLIRAEMGFGSTGATKGATGFRATSLRHVNRENPSRNEQMIWREFPDHLQLVADRFRDVLIENRHAELLIRLLDHPTTLFYVDPPYLLSTRAMGSRSRCYRWEMSEEEHMGLLNQLMNLQGMVIVSGYSSSLYDSTLAGWLKIEKSCAASGGNGSVVRTECLWISPNAQDSQPQMRLFA